MIIEGSELAPVITTSLGNSSIYFIGSTELVIDASKSYDPDQPNSIPSCAWTCTS
jgi:hypothetical protein